MVILLCMCVCVLHVYVCICVCMFMGSHVCINVREVYVCTRGARGWHRASFSVAAHLIKGGRISHWNPEPAGSASLGSHLASGNPCICLPSTRVTATCCWEPELTLAWRAFYPLSNSPFEALKTISPLPRASSSPLLILPLLT